MPYFALISLGITVILMFFSVAFKVAGKLRLTIPLIYFLLTATFLNKWAAAHETLALAILFALIAMTIISWLYSLKKALRNRRYTKTLEEDISWQIARAREKGIPLDSVHFDNSGEMRYDSTNESVD